MSPIANCSQPLRATNPEFQTWLDNHVLTDADVQAMTDRLASLASHPMMTVVMPVVESVQQSFLQAAIASVSHQLYPHWQLYCVVDAALDLVTKAAMSDDRIHVLQRSRLENFADAVNMALAEATGDFLLVLGQHDRLAPHALFEVAVLLNQHPEADLVYSDEAQITDDDRLCDPSFKPDWSPETLLSYPYIGNLAAYRRSRLVDLGGWDSQYGQAATYDVVLRLSEQTTQILHSPQMLYYRRATAATTLGEGAYRALVAALERRGEAARVLPHDDGRAYTVRYTIQAYDRVSIIIPTRDLPDLLADCLESIFTQTTYPNYEVIVVDNGSVEPATHSLFAHWQAKEPDRFRCIPLDIPFNYPRLNNVAAQAATGTYLLFLNNDTKVITPDWVTAMVEYAQRATIGAVGATLLYPDGSVQHAGVQVNGGSTNITIAHNHVRNWSAVTAACLLCRRSVFEEIGGFDETLAIAFNDVDMCLKLLEKGYRNVCLPHVLLYHYESKSRGLENTPEKVSHRSEEIGHFVTRWLKYIRHDPYLSHHYVWRCYQPDFDYSLSVVVPWWDHTEFLELWERNMHHLRHAQVIFVDNGSQPEGEQALREFCHRHQVTLIRNATNLGFAAANNQGLEIATGTFLLHLNNDLEILELPWAFLCASAMEGLSGAGPCFNELGIRYVEGWALCANRHTLQRLGGWTEDYGPGYWDDVDLCYRFTTAGYQMVPVPALKHMIRHVTNATGRDGRLDQIALHLRNRGRFIQKYLRTYPKIMIDGVFFQRYKTGIARVWRTLLEEWAHTDFAQYLVLLDRAGTAPCIPEIRTRRIPPHDYNRLEDDRELLQELCDEEAADLFVSTYYSTPLTTPSVLMVHDMIPEVAATKDSDVNLDDFMWREKRQAIEQASAYIAVSESTARDLLHFFPAIDPARVTIAKEGVAPVFKPASLQAIANFQRKYGINKPYFLLVGSSIGYKNTILFYRSLAYLASRQGFDIVSVGSAGVLEDEFRACTEGITVHLLRLSDEELAVAYSGAIALVYPSQYEGFGLPIVEAMACGCPVITCANGSIPEVAGDAVLYVDDSDVVGMAEALCEVQKPTVRQRLYTAGQAQAAQFSWTKMAEVVAKALIEATLLPLNLSQQNLILFPDWSQPEEALATELAMVIQQLVSQVGEQPTTLLVDTTDSTLEAVDELFSGVVMALALEEGMDVTETMQISLVPKLGDLQWQALLPRLTAKLAMELESTNARRVVGLPQLKLAISV